MAGARATFVILLSTLCGAAACGCSAPAIRARGVTAARAAALAPERRPARPDRERVYKAAVAVLARDAIVRYTDLGRGLILAEMPVEAHRGPQCRRTVHVQIALVPGAERTDENFKAEIHILEEAQASPKGASIAPDRPRGAWRVVAEDAARETALDREVATLVRRPGDLDLGPGSGRPAPALAGRGRAEQRTVPAGTRAGDGDTVAAVVSKGEKPARTEDVDYADLEALGVHYFKIGRYDLAAVALECALEIDPMVPFGHYLLGHARFACGDYAAAAESIARGLELNPDFVAGDLDLAALYGDPTRLAAQRDRLAARAGADPHLAFMLGYVLHMSHDYVGAAKVLAGVPDDANAARLLRLASVRAGERAGLRAY